MKFGQHLLSHLTPEWRKQYVNYEELKDLLYKMIGNEATTYMDEVTGLTVYTVDTELQDQFFVEVHKQLRKVESFFKAQEAEAKFKFIELKGEATSYQEKQTHGHRSHSLLQPTGGPNIEVLKLAFSEYYLNLILLQNYQQLNYTAFRKILKKHDKLATSFEGNQLFKQRVKDNHFYTSDQVEKLISETENIFAICLEGGDKARAMKKLRVPPLGGKMSHWVTLRSGIFMGITLTSIIVIILAVIFHRSDGWSEDWEALYHGLRAGMLIVLALYGFAINTYVWRITGVNSTLIFEFDPRDYRSFTQLFEVASLMGVVWIICACLFVFADMLGIPAEIGPSVMLLIFPAIFFMPLPIFYFRSRLWLMRILGRIVLAPFFYVTFADFWLADQLNSLAVVLLDVEAFGCWVAWGNHNPDSNPECGKVTYGLRPILAVLPAWWRFAQCLRRYRDTRHVFPHLVNAGKYSTTFFVVFFSSLAAALKDEDDESVGYYVAFFLWIISALISTAYTFSWDIKMDWGLFDGKFFLREQLIYPKKIYYILAIFEDLVFRSLWTLNISVGEVEILPHRLVLTSVLAVMEVFRRFIWNFFRLEAEHLSNVGEFRAVRDISLRQIKRQPKEDKDEDGDILSPLPANLQRGASPRLVYISSSHNVHNTSIRSSDISSIRSLDLQHSVAGSCTLVAENECPSLAGNNLELVTPNQHVVQAEVMEIAETNM